MPRGIQLIPKFSINFPGFGSKRDADYGPAGRIETHRDLSERFQLIGHVLERMVEIDNIEIPGHAIESSFFYTESVAIVNVTCYKWVDPEGVNSKGA